MSPGWRFRTLLEASGILVLPGVFTGFSVRLAAAISGAGASESAPG
jgi:hypothetical protein